MIASAIRATLRLQREGEASSAALMTAKQAATYLATSVSTVRSLAKSGAIRSATIGESLRFRPAWLDTWIDGGGGPVDRVSKPSDAEAATAKVVREVRPSVTPPRPPISRPPAKPNGPVPAAATPEGRPLYLLRRDPVDRRGISHYGFEAREPLCRRATEPLKITSLEVRYGSREEANCRPCLNEAGHVLGSRVVDLGLKRITMRTVDRRGDGTFVRQDGWHFGNGRTTWCGQTRDTWDLAFRSPGGSGRRCLDCHEREIYLSERSRGSSYGFDHGNDPLRRQAVLLDAGVEGEQIMALTKRAPELFDVRRAVEPLVAPPDDDYRFFSREYDQATQLLGKRVPLTGAASPSLVVAPRLVNTFRWVVAEARAEALVKEIVARAERRKTLRAKWDREMRVARGRVS